MEKNTSTVRWSAIFFSVLLFVASFIIQSSTRVTYAGPKEWVFKLVSKVVPEVDITRTVQNMVIETATGVPLSLATQRNADEIFSCGVLAKIDATDRDTVQAELVAAGMPSDQIPKELDKAEAMRGTTVCDFRATDMASRNGGSLFAFGTLLENTVDKGVTPVNLAVYFKDIARRTPILRDTAYAATGYGFVGEEAALVVWKIMRNLAYGIVSVSMIIVGIMIMMRRKINPQTVVTVQSALPRLIMVLVLITFSFPIGATIAAMVGPAMRVSKSIFEISGMDVLAAGATNLPMILVMWLAGVLIVHSGITGLIVAVFLLIMMLIFWVIVYIKMLMCFFRIIFHTVTAPLTFAMGAIPGKEDTIGNWFKGVAAEVVAVGAMFFMMRLATFVGAISLTGAFNKPTPLQYAAGGFVLSDILTLCLAPVVMLMIMGSAIKMPITVKGWILGDAAKKRR
ncbi:MAG: hypothetical protein WC243_00315 [Patescibacteria group bacterium]|jgi:hypothetical protein